MNAEKVHIPNFDLLLAKTDAFISTMYYVKDSFGLIPDKKHIGTCINFSDLLEMREEFIRELVATTAKYVYSKDKQDKIKQELINEGRDESDAAMILGMRVREKFRKDDIRGQFSELLLFNLLQYHFKAIPLMRKMPITTNPNLERNGADAIHIAQKDGKYILYLGEAKTYNRNQYGLSNAIRDSLDSILKHYETHRSEINLYIFEDFIPNEIENIAKFYYLGKLDLEVHLVCMVSYNNNEEIKGSDKQEYLDCVINCIRNEAKRIHKGTFSKIPSNLYPRINYIIFPISELDDLLNTFRQKLGV